MSYHLIIRSEAEDRVYTRSAAANLARISLELLDLCEREKLIRPQRMAGGEPGFSPADIRRLARIRRLQEDLGLDLSAVEVVLHMRHRMIELLTELELAEQERVQREETLRSEIRWLRRRLAEDVDWR